VGDPHRPRCIFDCVVPLQAAISRGPAFAVLTLVEAGRLELLLSAALISELRDVLFRTEVQQKFPGLSTEFIEFSSIISNE
jgi:predicted nucleic acid-binding protein